MLNHIRRIYWYIPKIDIVDTQIVDAKLLKELSHDERMAV